MICKMQIITLFNSNTNKVSCLLIREVANVFSLGPAIILKKDLLVLVRIKN